MVNKTIHYCWFGRGKKSKLIKKCIKSWKKYLPSFEIKEWNEDNFDINHNVYIKQAYEAKKYAFVSDYVRFYVLEKYGGLYLDTDVEVIKPLDELLEYEAFSGFEVDDYVAPGLILWSKTANNEIIKKAREWYDNNTFFDENGIRKKGTVGGVFTSVLKKYGFIPNGKLQCCGNVTCFPKEFFNPLDDSTGIIHKTENTYTIHYYAKSWMGMKIQIRTKITRIIHRIFGKDIRQKLTRKKK